jgi:hypothetical protein
MQADSGPVVRFESAAPSPDLPDPPSHVRVVVLDTAWTPTPAQAANGRWIAVRSIAAPILADVDLLAEATRRLDAWVSSTTVIEDMTIDGTSLWFYVRLHDHGWLQQRMLWTMIVDAIVRETRPSRIELGESVDQPLVEVAPLVAKRDGLPIDGASAGAATRPEVGSHAAAPDSPAATSIASRIIRRLRAAISRPTAADLRSRERGARRRLIAERMAALAGDPGRLLVVLEHARQRVETPDGPREMNPFLGPIVNVLRGGPLDPIELDLKARIDDDESWSRLVANDGQRLLPVSVIRGGNVDDDADLATSAADEEAAMRIAASGASLVVADVDLGPLLAGHVAEQARRLLPRKRRAVAQIRGLLRRLRPAGILLADEYHRQEWLIAAAAEGVQVAAVQHGILHRFHNGYIHASRPPSLRLPGRTYVFGRWERDLLIEHSVFREDEVVVGGSPRLDVVRAEPGDRAAIRTELGVAPGDRLVVVSGTHSAVIRRFQLPMALAALVDRPLPRVHVVVKLHPGERDDGPYRATIAWATAARGVAPPPVALIRSIDLYGLLAAADAHIGIHSTLLTEAVVTGTPNLTFASFASADLLGYIQAGVAVPFRSGADLLAVLDGAAGYMEPAARTAFIEAHMEPGSASRRIADDLSAWLA